MQYTDMKSIWLNKNIFFFHQTIFLFFSQFMQLRVPTCCFMPASFMPPSLMQKIYSHIKYPICHYAAYHSLSELQSIRTNQIGILLFQKHWLREIRKSSLAACFMEPMSQLSNSKSTQWRAIIWMYTPDN